MNKEEKIIKEYLEETMKDTLKEILTTKDQKNYVGKYKDISYNYDSINEYLFISLEMEDLTNVNLNNYFDYEDVSIIDLQDIQGQEIGIIEIVNDIFRTILIDIVKGEK